MRTVPFTAVQNKVTLVLCTLRHGAYTEHVAPLPTVSMLPDGQEDHVGYPQHFKPRPNLP